MNRQYELNKNVLELRVKKASLFVRSVLFLFTILFFSLPLFGIILRLTMGDGLHFGNIVLLIIFGVLGFYMLRISLWNTYGKETITFESNHVIYIADYGWFKDGKKHKEIKEPLVYLVRQIGYEEDNKGVLVIEMEEPINCVTKIPIEELKELINKLNDVDNVH